MKKKVTLLNVISSLLLQFVSFISYFIIPKIILSYFGSSVNGLVSSLNQFLNFITLVEGGVTGVIIANLYKPLIEKNFEKISSILATANKFYRKIGLIFIAYSIILGLVYKFIFNVQFNLFYIFTLTMILSINFFVQYLFAVTNKALLTADKKMYIINFSQIVMIILNIIFSIISIKIYPSIHLLKFISGLLYILQPVVFGIYIKKNYNITKKVKIDNSLIKQRWDSFSINVAAFIHSSTDIVILTIFTNMITVSIYSVYSLVTNGIKQIITSISSAIVPVVGQSYAKKDDKDFIIKFNVYEYIIFFITFFIFSIALLLITPFVQLYTANISDANYYQPIFGVLIIVSEMLYIIKFPHLNLAYSANKFKEITKAAYIEAFLNAIISIILVSEFGLLGVTIGTIVAMTYRMVFQVKFTNKLVPQLKTKYFYKKMFIFTLGSFIAIIISRTLFGLSNVTLLKWIIYGIIYCLVFIFIYIIISIKFFKEELNYLKNYLKK